MAARAVLAIAALAGCAHSGGAAPTRPSAATTATEAYLGRLIAGDRAAIAGAVSGPPAIDDPFGGAVLGDVALRAFVAQPRPRLTVRAARVTPGPTTRAAGQTVVEAVLHLHHEGRDVDLPIAVVGDDAPDGR